MPSGPLECVRKPCETRPRNSLLLLNFIWALSRGIKVYLSSSEEASTPGRGGKPGNHTTPGDEPGEPESPPGARVATPPPPPGDYPATTSPPLTLYRSNSLSLSRQSTTYPSRPVCPGSHFPVETEETGTAGKALSAPGAGPRHVQCNLCRSFPPPFFPALSRLIPAVLPPTSPAVHFSLVFFAWPTPLTTLDLRHSRGVSPRRITNYSLRCPVNSLPCGGC